MPSLDDIPLSVLNNLHPRGIINWLQPMKLSNDVKKTFLRLWSKRNNVLLSPEDYRLVLTNQPDTR